MFFTFATLYLNINEGLSARGPSARQAFRSRGDTEGGCLQTEAAPARRNSGIVLDLELEICDMLQLRCSGVQPASRRGIC